MDYGLLKRFLAKRAEEGTASHHRAVAGRLKAASAKATDSTTKYKLHRAAAKHDAIARQKCESLNKETAMNLDESFILEQEFESLSTAMSDGVRAKLPDYYMVDFSESSVLLRSNTPMAEPGEEQDIYYMADYSFDEMGELVFTTPVKVSRVVMYVPVQESLVGEKGMNPGFAAYLAKKKAAGGKTAPATAPVATAGKKAVPVAGKAPAAKGKKKSLPPALAAYLAKKKGGK